MVTVPEQLPNVLDRAIRIALAQRAPTAVIIPADVQELRVHPADARVQDGAVQPGHRLAGHPPDDAARSRGAAELLNAGKKVAMLVGQGARGARGGGRGRSPTCWAPASAKALLGKDVLPDDLPYVTGSIGLLGTRPSYEMMRGCDTLLTIGSSFPYTQFMPEFGQARGVQIDVDAGMIGMRYPYEVNMVADARPPCGP